MASRDIKADIEKPLVCKLDEDTLEDKEKEEKAPLASLFKARSSLALSMAFWVTVFYIPVIIPSVHQAFFVDLDLPNMLGSPDFESYWPNTVQLIVFTVYFSTGSTTKLAWQGLAGTVAAGLNQAFMGKLFPVGGKCLKVAAYTGSGLRGFCEEYADPNYARYEWFVWFDVIAFYFLILSSNAQENTMKFSMSWHSVYMMAFMSPAGFQPSHAVNITSVIGVSLAIIITLVPARRPHGGIILKHMVANELEAHPLNIAKKMGQISTASLNFVLRDKPQTLDERYHYKVDKVAITQRIDELSKVSAKMSDDFATSWWEGWLYLLKGGPGACEIFHEVRTHCGIFAEAFEDDIGGFDDVTFIMKKVINAADVGAMVDPAELADASSERDAIGNDLQELNDKTLQLLQLVASWKQVHADYDKFTRDVQDLMGTVDQLFYSVFEKYHNWIHTYPVKDKSRARQMMRNNMNIFVFALLQLSKEVVDLAFKVNMKYKTKPKSKKEIVQRSAEGMLSQMKATYITDGKPAFLKAMVNPEKKSFVLRNLFSIGLCFVMGNLLEGNVFASPFNATLAGTLSVLVSHFPGSAFYKNLMRLLGLAIGNALPVVMLAFVSLCGSWKAEAHLLAFFLFTLYFGMMYYTSPEWGYVGCIVAGFGCYSFTTEVWSQTTFAAAYCKIGQVTAAIAVQIIVDIIDTTIRKKFPQDIVVENMKKMLNNVVKVFEDFKEHMSSAKHGELSLIKDIKERAKETKALMASQQQLVSECEAKTTMIAGPSPPFKLELYKKTLGHLEDLLGEIDAMCLLDEFSDKISKVRKDETHWFTDSYKGFYAEVVSGMKQTFDTLLLIFERKTEALIPKEKVKVVMPNEEVKLHTESLRMATINRIMVDSFYQVLQIEQLCCESGALEFSDN